VRFEHPQPAQTNNLTEFPEKVRGVYSPHLRDFFYLDYADIKDMGDALTDHLDFSIQVIDSNTYEISEHAIVEWENEGIILRKETFRDYVKKLHRLNNIKAVEAILSNGMCMKCLDIDSVFIYDNILAICYDDYTFELMFSEDSISLVIDSLAYAAMHFGRDYIDFMYDDSYALYKVHVTDTFISGVFEEDTLEFSFNDSTCLVIEEHDTTGQILLAHDSAFLFFDDEVLSAPIIEGYIHMTDRYDRTFFRISDASLLRKFKGAYYLNEREGKADSCLWNVSQLRLKDDLLSISEICGCDDPYESLCEITEVDKKGCDYVIDPSKREFRKLLKEVGFTRTTWFTKLE
jgi:hypothetical protein